MAGIEKDWRDEITIEELPDGLKRYAQIIGVKGAIRLAEEEGGLPLYIPKADKVLDMIRNRRIQAEFTGSNLQALSRKYDLTVRHIYNILGLTDKPESPQMDLVKYIEENSGP